MLCNPTLPALYCIFVTAMPKNKWNYFGYALAKYQWISNWFFSSFFEAFGFIRHKCLFGLVIFSRTSLALFLVSLILLPVTQPADEMSNISIYIISFTLSCENFERIIDLGAMLLQIFAQEALNLSTRRAFDAAILLEQTSTENACLLKITQKAIGKYVPSS